MKKKKKSEVLRVSVIHSRCVEFYLFSVALGDV